MEIVLGTHGFVTPGGSETYVLTVAEQFRRLGHEVTIHAAQGGVMSDLAESRGLTVALDEQELPDAADAILVQDAAMAYVLADRYPLTPQVFRACTDVFDHQLPPNIPDVASSVVVVSDRVARHVAALNVQHDIVRLRQPIDTARFRPDSEIGDRPRRALLLGNYLTGRRGRMLAEAWEAEGVECVVIGAHGNASTEPAVDLNAADIVVGKARAILEGMACGRAAYVFDFAGGDGWVTPDVYPAMERDNFAGVATSWMIDTARLRMDLAAYRPEMGLVNRDLVVSHHAAGDHAHALIDLFRKTEPRVGPVDAPLRELARLGRLSWSATQEARYLRSQLGRAAKRMGQLEARAAAADAAEERLAELEQYIETVEADAADLRRQLSTRRVRVGLALGRLGDRVRP